MSPMPPPPRQLDGADVLMWATSRRGLFYTIPDGSDPAAEGVLSVAAMAICQYPAGDRYYLFKCDQDWNVVFDWDAASIDEARGLAGSHVTGEAVAWVPAR